MYEHVKLRSLDDFFVNLNGRPAKGVHFYRINGYSEQIEQFIKKYYDAARKSGVVIEGKIPNPDEKNLSYYGETMGMNFSMNAAFISQSLKKWLPRMNDLQRTNVADSIYDSLSNMLKAGKTENMLKNAYIKFMCWLYYKFERIVNQLGNDELPKILYEGEISNYELMLISILSNAGCDVVLLQYSGDQAYLKVDPQSSMSDAYEDPNAKPFAPDFSLKKIREKIQKDFNNQRLYGQLPEQAACTNAWIKGEGLEDAATPTTVRGSDEGFFYNCFMRINGAEDKMIYANVLYQFQVGLENAKRKVRIINGEIPRPDNVEISAIRRGNYTRQDQMIMDLAKNIQPAVSTQLQRIINKAFVDVMLEEAETEGVTLNKLINKAVFALCWLRRYQSALFGGWKKTDVGCFIKFGPCKTEYEVLFLKMLSRTPVDVIILCPNLNEKCILTDKYLYEKNYTESVVMDKYPSSDPGLQMGTVAYHAERELDTIMYQDSGMYRNRQYSSANIVNLQTMYEEIAILWDQELKYRPGFSTVDGVVALPVIFAKISGVKDGNQDEYWTSVRRLITADTTVIGNLPMTDPNEMNPVRPFVAEFYKNGRLQREKIKEHHSYQYGILREETQNLILDKIELLINRKLVKGIGQNGTEYTVVGLLLNLPKDIVRKIQNFDFTKKNPKLIVVNTTEKILSLEDSILIAFLNLIGFDIVFFVPTGYQCVEKFYNEKIMAEHQIGDYMYDLQVPTLSMISTVNNSRHSWRDKFFRRGGK